MPREKTWRKSESRRAVIGEQAVLEVVSHRQTLASVQVQNPASVQIQSPVSEQARSPASMQANASKSQKDNEKGKTTATCIVLQLIGRSTKSWNVVRPFLGVIIKMIKIF